MKERVFKEEVDLKYPYELYILAKAVVGDRYRSIPRLRRIGWKTLFKMLDQVMEENPGAGNTTLKLKLIEKVKGKSSLTNEMINANLNAINIELQKDSMMKIDRTLVDDQIIDVPDYNNLQEMNRTKFMEYPINLQFLCNTKERTGPMTPFDP